MKKNVYFPLDKKEIFYLIVTCGMIFLDYYSTLYRIFKISLHMAEFYDPVILTANGIFLVLIFFYYYCLFYRQKSLRLLICLPFTVYLFLIFLLTSYDNIIPVLVLVLALQLLCMSGIKRRNMIIGGSLILIIYLVIMILHSLAIFPAAMKNGSFMPDKNFSYRFYLTALLVCIFLGLLTIISSRKIVVELNGKSDRQE